MSKSMMTLGLTGGIGSGKSYVSRLLQERNISVYDTDFHAKELINTHPSIRKALIGLLGKDVYLSDGVLDKKKLVGYLFACKENADRINSIVHPCVKEDLVNWFAAHVDKRFVAVESAILYESGLDVMVDKVILVYAPLELRIRRAMSRDHATEEQIRARVAAQQSDEEKRLLADFVLYNDGVMDLDVQIDSLLDKLADKKL